MHPSSRGIKNISRVSCHISCGLQLIYHALSPTCRNNLIELSRVPVHAHVSTENMNEGGGDVNGKVLALLILLEFGIIFRQMGERRDDGIDASNLYQLFASKIDSTNVGDAGASLRTILRILRQSLEECSSSINNNNNNNNNNSISKSDHQVGNETEITLLAKSILDDCNTFFWKGTLSHQITGTMLTACRTTGNDTNETCRVMRSKPSQERPWPCPVPIPVKGYRTITVSLCSIVSSSQSINGYEWDAINQSEYKEERCVLENNAVSNTNRSSIARGVAVDSEQADNYQSASDSSDDSCSSASASGSSSSSSSSSSSDMSIEEYMQWKTKKTVCPVSLPNVIILHLSRSEYKGGRIKKVTDGIDVPFELDLNGCGIGHNYELAGAIVHKDEVDARSNDDESGHYLSYMKEETGSNHLGHNKMWKKIDDERVYPFEVGRCHSLNTKQKVVSPEALAAMFGGKTRKKSNCATILMYKQI